MFFLKEISRTNKDTIEIQWKYKIMILEQFYGNTKLGSENNFRVLPNNVQTEISDHVHERDLGY